jgi:hypothetical protein
MTTPARYRALQWFLDHEVLGPDAVLLGRKPPSTKMRRLMAREGQVIRLPLGQFEYQKWLLTPLGRETLQRKPRRGLPRLHSHEKETTE